MDFTICRTDINSHDAVYYFSVAELRHTQFWVCTPGLLTCTSHLARHVERQYLHLL